jgi:hypothetical protein
MAAVTIRNLYEEAHRALNGAAQSQRGGGNARHSGSGRAPRGPAAARHRPFGD